MKYIYGPVNSRRLGVSLGISLTPYKTCNFDCVYCQLGRTIQKKNRREEYIYIDDILKELKTWLKTNKSGAGRLNYLTFSGSGEPTLNIKIGGLITQIKKLTSISIAVITNSSYLSSSVVRGALRKADLIVPSLDAVTQNIFEKIDRPEKSVKIKDIIDGLINLRREFSGKIWLEVMLIKGINDGVREVKKLKTVIDKIKPDKIQLNSPVRATAEPDILPVDKDKLEKIRKIFGERCEIM